jgi:hypothetical protein
VNVAALRDRLAAVTAADRDVDASVKKWVESDTKLALAAASALMLVFAAGSAAWWFAQAGARRTQIAALEAEHAEYRRTMDQRQAALDANYRSTDLASRWKALARENLTQNATSAALARRPPPWPGSTRGPASC